MRYSLLQNFLLCSKSFAFESRVAREETNQNAFSKTLKDNQVEGSTVTIRGKHMPLIAGPQC